jgi:hypothetical protein
MYNLTTYLPMYNVKDITLVLLLLYSGSSESCCCITVNNANNIFPIILWGYKVN